MNHVGKRMALAGLVFVALIGASAGPVRADGGNVESEAVTVSQSELSASERSLLAAAGLKGAEVTIRPFDEYTLVSDGNNWVIMEEGSGDTALR